MPVHIVFAHLNMQSFIARRKITYFRAIEETFDSCEQGVMSFELSGESSKLIAHS